MDYQNVSVLNTTNFLEWRDKVKTRLLTYEPEVWKLVCDGYCTESPTVKEQQRNAKAKCVIYDSLHNKDLLKPRKSGLQQGGYPPGPDLG